jgi:hypothetical protein
MQDYALKYTGKHMDFEKIHFLAQNRELKDKIDPKPKSQNDLLCKNCEHLSAFILMPLRTSRLSS